MSFLTTFIVFGNIKEASMLSKEVFVIEFIVMALGPLIYLLVPSFALTILCAFDIHKYISFLPSQTPAPAGRK